MLDLQSLSDQRADQEEADSVLVDGLLRQLVKSDKELEAAERRAAASQQACCGRTSKKEEMTPVVEAPLQLQSPHHTARHAARHAASQSWSRSQPDPGRPSGEAALQ